MSRDERDEVPAAMSSCSMSAARIPRDDGVEQGAGADDPAADDDDVPRLVGERRQVGRAARRAASAAVGARAGSGVAIDRRSPTASGRPARDPPQQPAGPDDEDDDRERRVEDDLLERRSAGGS